MLIKPETFELLSFILSSQICPICKIFEYLNKLFEYLNKLFEYLNKLFEYLQIFEYLNNWIFE